MKNIKMAAKMKAAKCQRKSKSMAAESGRQSGGMA